MIQNLEVFEREYQAPLRQRRLTAYRWIPNRNSDLWNRRDLELRPEGVGSRSVGTHREDHGVQGRLVMNCLGLRSLVAVVHARKMFKEGSIEIRIRLWRKKFD